MTEIDQCRRTLRELAEEASVPPRTIRFYISRGLLAAPLVAGRRASYGEEHLERLKKIRELQRKGLTLGAIAGVLRTHRNEADLPQPTSWSSYQIQEDVIVWVSAGGESWRVKQIRVAIKQFADQLRVISEGA